MQKHQELLVRVSGKKKKRKKKLIDPNTHMGYPAGSKQRNLTTGEMNLSRESSRKNVRDWAGSAAARVHRCARISPFPGSRLPTLQALRSHRDARSSFCLVQRRARNPLYTSLHPPCQQIESAIRRHSLRGCPKSTSLGCSRHEG